MRLTSEQRSTLLHAVHRHFGDRARAWVFGSRLDDRARGGDFDVMVGCDELDAPALVEARLTLLADLHARSCFEDERIDVVLWSRLLDPVPRPIQRVALETGQELSA